MTEAATASRLAAWQQRSIADLILEYPKLMPVFEKLGLDYCCHGKMKFSEACATAGVDREVLMAEVASLDRTGLAVDERSSLPRWDVKTVDELINYIVERHHTFTRNALAELGPLLEKICQVHGAEHPELTTVRSLYLRLKKELNEHLSEEENVWFPHMTRLAKLDAIISKHSCCDPKVEITPEHQMMKEHLEVGDLLKSIRAVTTGFLVPQDGCATYHRTYQALRGLERDLHEHIHLENNVLLPKVKDLELQRLSKKAVQ